MQICCEQCHSKKYYAWYSEHIFTQKWVWKDLTRKTVAKLVPAPFDRFCGFWCRAAIASLLILVIVATSLFSNLRLKSVLHTRCKNEIKLWGVILRHVITSTALRLLIYQIMMKKNRDIIFRPTLKLKTHIYSLSSRQQTGAQSHVNFWLLCHRTLCTKKIGALEPSTQVIISSQLRCKHSQTNQHREQLKLVFHEIAHTLTKYYSMYYHLQNKISFFGRFVRKFAALWGNFQWNISETIQEVHS